MDKAARDAMSSDAGFVQSPKGCVAARVKSWSDFSS
jgi:hypothetical protein